MSREAEKFASTPSELRRIELAGVLWSSAQLLAGAVAVGAAVSGGWRPSSLPDGLAGLWWAAAALALLGVAATVWAGCPVLGKSLETDDRWKSISIRAGLAAYGIGTATATVVALAAG